MKNNFLIHKNIYVLIAIFLINFIFVLHTQTISSVYYSGKKLDTLLNYSSPHIIILNVLCVTCVLFLNKVFQRVLFTVNIIFCTFINTYIHILKQPPTLTSIYNGIQNTKDISLAPYLSYDIIVIALCAIVIINILITKAKSYIIPKKYVFLLCAIILGIHSIISANNSFGDYKKNIENLSQNLRISIQLRGIIATMLLELTSQVYKKGSEAFSLQKVNPSRDLSHLPTLSASKNIVFIQVECLGYELLNEKVDNHLVMPFLNSLQKSSVVLKLDGIKLLGSANSDYEVLTTRKASKDFMAYDFVTNFSDSLIDKFKKNDFRTRFFHNAHGAYMNRRSAYKLIGFEYRYFSEEMRKSGYTPLNTWKGRVFSDMDLFDFAQKHPQDASKNFDFIITMSMHEPNYTKGTVNPFASSAHAVFFKACHDTDTALKQYYETLPEGTLLIIYGDHSAYFGNRTPFAAFVAHIKGKNIAYSDSKDMYLRTDISHYLRSIRIIE